MDRKIIFRGKSVENGEWIYGDLVRCLHPKGGYGHFIHVSSTDIEEENIKTMVDASTVGQFSGTELSKEHPMFADTELIFEGDIIRLSDSNTLYEVIFRNNAFLGVSNESDKYGFYTCSLTRSGRNKIIKVGNKFDNTDFMK